MKTIKSYFFAFTLWVTAMYYLCKWWVINIWAIYVHFKDGARIFSGWQHYKLAIKYAEKRSKLSATNKLLGGKRHYVLPFGNEKLIVVNRQEIIRLKNQKIFKKSLNIVDIIKHAYHITV